MNLVENPFNSGDDNLRHLSNSRFAISFGIKSRVVNESSVLKAM